MQSKAKNVDAYLAEAPAERRDTLKKIRALCLAELHGYEETMRYGGPGYEKDGVIEVGFASQKNFVGLYILKTDVINAYKEMIEKTSVGKGVIRYTNLSKIDFDLIRKMLAATYTSKNSICD